MGLESKHNPEAAQMLLSELTTNPAFAEAVSSVFHRDVFGCRSDSFDVDRLQFLAAGISSSQYVIRHMAKARRLDDAGRLLQFAVEHLASGADSGLVLEFGVYSGGTINHIASLVPHLTVHGFDSFQGLPEDWRPGFPQGAFALAGLPDVRANVRIVPGWFDRTLPGFLDQHPGKSVALLHIDCDLYSSTQVILQQLKSRLVPGTIIVFDEYYNYPGWELNEFRAFREFVEAQRIHYEYLGLVPGHQQVAVRIGA